MYASLFGISGALHLAVFEQPEQQVFFSDLLGRPIHYSLSCPEKGGVP
jgi:hypothetical protein